MLTQKVCQIFSVRQKVFTHAVLGKLRDRLSLRSYLTGCLYLQSTHSSWLANNIWKGFSTSRWGRTGNSPRVRVTAAFGDWYSMSGLCKWKNQSMNLQWQQCEWLINCVEMNDILTVLQNKVPQRKYLWSDSHKLPYMHNNYSFI